MTFNSEKQKYLRLALIIIAVFLFVVITVKNFAFNGEMSGLYTSEKRSAFISGLKPLSRLDQLGKRDDYQVIMRDPAYINLRIARPFKEVQVEIVYQKPDDLVLNIGVLKNLAEWKFHFLPSENISEPLADGWQKATAVFDMRFMAPEEKNIYKIILSSPGLAADVPEKGIKVKEARVVLRKDPLTWRNFSGRLSGYVGKWF